jgi:hypothetical protein
LGHKSTVDLALTFDALDAILSSQEAREKADIKIDDVAQKLDRLCRMENTKEERRMLELIGAGDADETYRANLKLHQHGTGWCTESPEPGRPYCRLWLSARLWTWYLLHMESFSTIAVTETSDLGDWQES